VQLFAENPNLDTAAYAVASTGFHWHNFYYINGPFVSRLAEPNSSAKSRFYYEKTWIREMPTHPETSACSGLTPVFGQRVSKGIEITTHAVAKNTAFQVAKCEVGKTPLRVSANKMFFAPLAKAMKARISTWQANHHRQPLLSELRNNTWS
jgi:hypothetical protein